MPRRSVRSRRRSLGCLSFAIGALAVIAVGLVCAIALSDRLRPAGTDVPVRDIADENYVDVNDLPETQIVLMADSFSEEYLPAGAAEGSESEAGDGAPERASGLEDPGTALVTASDVEELLPVFKKADTGEKVIAITLDECSGAEVTGNFVNMANHFGAKLTMFPSGENLMKTGMAQLMKECVFNYGFEVENRGYSEVSKVFQYTTGMMVQEIWKQSIALNFVLGVKYEPHFYRMYGGLGEQDPRTHAYLKQQNYIGIAHWTVAMGNVDFYSVADKLTPGGVYQFKSTAEDGQRMYALMEAARDQGYRMVTLNELFGYEANSCHEVQGSLLAETMPEFSYNDSVMYNLFPGDSSWAVTRLQSRLTQLGYLPENSADGIFGDATSQGLRLFQAQIGRPASGAADIDTQRQLFSLTAPRNPSPLSEPGSTPQPELLEEKLVPVEADPGQAVFVEEPREEEPIEEEPSEDGEASEE